jgi:hypothetical protein
MAEALFVYVLDWLKNLLEGESFSPFLHSGKGCYNATKSLSEFRRKREKERDYFEFYSQVWGGHL